MVLSILITVVLCVLAYFNKKSKVVFILFLLFIWLLFGWNYWNGDYESYERFYNTYTLIDDIGSNNYEIGYKYLSILGHTIGLTFQEYFISISFIILLLWARFILKFSEVPALFILCFFIAFLPLDYVLLRNFLAFSIVIQGFVPIFFNTKYKYQKYIICVLIAFTIHSSSLFYLIMLLAFREKNLDIKLIAVLVVGGLLFIMLFDQYISVILSQTENRDEMYTSSPILFVLFSSYQILNTIFIYHFYKKQIKYDETETENILNTNTIILNINILLLLLIIPYLRFGIAIRLFRNIAMVNIMYITNMLYGNNRVRRNVLNTILLIVYICFFFINFILPVFDDTIGALYTYNLLFK